MRELRKWLLTLVLIITGGGVSLAVVVTWMSVTMSDWYEPDALNLPPPSLLAVLLVFSLALGVWLLALTARILELAIKKVTRP